jgi:NADH-ubiquinone oxidoreductase chain 4
MLILLILIPIIGALFILPMNETNSQNVSQMKKIALGSTILNFFISLFIWYKFDSNTTQYQFVSSVDLTDTLQFCHLNFGIDGISLFFVLLTTFVSPIAILSNYNNILIGNLNSDNLAIKNILEKANVKLFLVSLLLLESLQICAFVSLDLLLFYIFF